MKTSPGFRRLLPLVATFTLLWAGSGNAAPPLPGELEGYAADGTLAERVEFAKAIGNDRFDPALIAQAKHKLQRLVMEAQGIDPATAETIAGAPPPAWQGMPTTGTNKVLCLLIEFNDLVHEPANTQAAIHDALFGAGNPVNSPYESLTAYYQRSSYNKLTLQGNTLGWYKTAYNRSAVVQSTAGRENLIKEAINHYEALGHDFSQYDNNGDGEVDLVYVIYAGQNNGWGNFWWAYQTSWQDTAYKKDGKGFGTYVFQFQNYDVATPFTPRVIIHETGHALGIPDFYDYDVNVGPDGGVGGLDIMHGNLGDHNCFSKWVLGWLTPTVVAGGSQNLTLRASGTSEDCVMIIPGAGLGGQFSEFFMVQNRTKLGNDNASDWPGAGMMVWHIDSTLTAGGQDYLYNNSYTGRKMLRLMEADGLEEIENNGAGDAGDFYAQGKSFNLASVPNSRRYNGTDSLVSVTNFSAAQTTMSAQFAIIGAGVPPTVAISAPAGGAAFAQGAAIPVAATASDDGSVASVAFYGDGALISVDTSDPYAASWAGAAAGGHLLTAVATDNSGLTTTSAAVSVTVTAAGGPPNDHFASRTTIVGNVATVTGSNTNASAEASEPSHAGRAPQRSVWWTWTPSVTGTATVTTAGSNFDTVLAAYTGATLATLVAKGSNDDVGGGLATSSIVFAVTAGVPIQLAVDGYNGASGSVTLNVSAVAVAPGNDAFAGAIAISNLTSPVNVTGSNNGGTSEAGEPAHAGFGPFASSWWMWTAPAKGTLQVSTAGSNFDTLLGVYTGTTVNALTLRASNDDTVGQTSSVSLPVAVGTTYFIAVDGYNGATGAISLQTSFYAENEPPTISLGSPRDGESIGLNSQLDIFAEAYDPEGNIDEVRFYIDGALVDTVPSHPESVSYETTRLMDVAGYHTVTATAEDNAGLTSSATVTIQVSAIPLPQALDNTGLAWTSGGPNFWSGTAANSHDGTSSAVSGVIGNSQSSWFSATVTGPGNLAFWWSVSSEASYDYLTFYVDGVAQAGKISGAVGWTPQSWSIPAGNHVVKWQYEKDSSVAAGSDAGWVDQVVWLTPPQLSGPSEVTAPTGVPLTYTLTADVSVASYSVAAGTLPPGLGLSTSTGVISGTPGTAGIFNVTLQGTNAAGSGTKAVTFTIFPATPLPDSVDAPQLTWTAAGNGNWFGQTAISHDGVDAARSGVAGDLQSNWLETTVSGPGLLSFWWKVSSESGYDYLRFQLDGAQQPGATQRSGEGDWQQVTLPVPAGSHTLRWTYAKDETVSAGSDAGWLDQVAFVSSAVTTLADSGPGSLRQMIADLPAGALITFAPALDGGTITLGGSQIPIGKSLTVDASSLPAGITLRGNNLSRIFEIAAGQSVTLAGLGLTGGNAPNGGAIHNMGSLVLSRCTVSGNVAASGGGGIHSQAASLTLDRCTVAGNTAAFGGGIWSGTGSTLELVHGTVAANTGTGGSGGIVFESGTGTVRHSIVAGNAGTTDPDFGGAGGTLTLSGTNLIGVQATSYAASMAAGAPNGSGHFIGTLASPVDARLAPLGSYGGPTTTMAPRPGSPALNAATGSTATNDQRGFPMVGTPDIGAYEAGTFTDFDAWIWEILPATASAGDHLASFDFDGDGATNGDEWSALTNPADPASVLRITESIVGDPNMSVTFPTVVGRNYTVEFSTSLDSWFPVGGATYAGTGAPITSTFGPVTGYPGFFVRVRVGP